MENFKKQERRFYKKILIMSIVACLLFFIVEIFSFYRLEFWGIVHGYAPPNFAFNIGIYLPAHFLALLFSIFVFIEVLSNWKVLIDRRKTTIPLCLSAVIILIDAYAIFGIIMM